MVGRGGKRKRKLLKTNWKAAAIEEIKNADVYQLSTIHMMINFVVLPLIYVLLPKSKKILNWIL